MIGQVTAAFPLPREVKVPLDIHERLTEYVDGCAVARRGPLIVRLLEAGLSNTERRRANNIITATINDMVTVLQAAADLDTEPSPCPRGVDPRWWSEQEHERLRAVTWTRQRALRDALDLAMKARSAL